MSDYYFQKNVLLFCLEIFFTFTNSVDPDEMQHYAVFHLGLCCLQKYCLEVSPIKQKKRYSGLKHNCIDLIEYELHLARDSTLKYELHLATGPARNEILIKLIASLGSIIFMF